MGRQESGGCTDHPAHLAYSDAVLAAVRQFADAHRHIDAFIHHVRHSVHQQGVDADLWITLQVTHQQRGDEQIAEQHRRSQAQLPPWLGVDAGGRGLGILHLGENASAVLQITLPGFAQVHLAGGAYQQLGADALFEGCHGPGDAGRRQVKAPRSRGEPLLLGDTDEHLHFLKPVHVLSHLAAPARQAPRTRSIIHGHDVRERTRSAPRACRIQGNGWFWQSTGKVGLGRRKNRSSTADLHRIANRKRNPG